MEWFGLGRLLSAAFAVVLVAAGAFWLLRSPVPSTESGLPLAARPTTPIAATRTGATAGTGAASGTSTAEGEASATLPPPTTLALALVVVHVAGAVQRPAVYRLPGGSRVVDAVNAAGGMGSNANGDGINLAGVLRDGERVYVPRIGEEAVIEQPEPSGAAAATPAPVDVNTATAEQLDALPGVGPSTAAAIIAQRQRSGPFQSVDELAKVRGIGPAKLEAIRGLVTV
ncbi:MAG: helix-hairpin-helix domain-containing protein [Ilumatobacteraceae bacterium]